MSGATGRDLVPVVAAGLLVALALSALVGWWIGQSVLTSWQRGLATMKPATAFCFLAMALALWPGRRWPAWVVGGAGLVVAAFGALSLLSSAVGMGPSPEVLLPRVGGGEVQSAAGWRMSGATAAGFAFAGLAVASSRGVIARQLGLPLAGLVGVVAIVALLGYAYGAQDLYALPFFESLSPPTAAGFLVLAVALVVATARSRPQLTLRQALAVLVASALLPALVFIASQSRRASDDRLTDLERAGRRLVDDVAQRVDGLFVERAARLEGLATSPALRGGDFSAFDAQVRQGLQLGGEGNLMVLDGTMAVRLNTGAEPGGALPPPVETESARQALSSGRMQVSDVFVDAANRHPVVALSVPVAGTGLVLRETVWSLSLSEILQAMTPVHWVVAVTDRKGVIAGRSRDPEKWVGKLAAQGARALALTSERGWSRTRTLEGLPIYFAWQRLPNGWTVLAGFEEQVERQTAYANMLRLTFGTIVTLVLGMTLALIGAATIERPLSRLADAADGLGRGDVPQPLTTHLREVDAVAAALAAAASARAEAFGKLEQSQQALQASAERLRAIVDTAVDTIIVIDESGIVQSVNPACEQMFGRTAQEIVGRNVAMLMPEPYRSLHDGYLADYCRTREAKVIGIGREVEGLRADGTTFPADLSVAEWRAGGQVYFTGILRDITDRKRSEDHVRMIMRELSHRTKNALAVVQAMAWQTSNTTTDIEDYQERFSRRIDGLRRSIDLLVKGEWEGADLRALVDSQLAPFIDRPSRLEVSGPAVVLTPNAAQDLGLVLHELATNASKYGALSTPEGAVTISWTLDETHGNVARLRLGWRERGGPPVSPPVHSSFGSTLIRNMLEMSYKAKVRLDFAESGLSWEVEMDTARVVRGASRAAKPRQESAR